MMDDKISSLDLSDSWWGSFLTISTLIVLLGVTAEALQFMKCISRQPKLKHSIEVAAFLVLVVGIAGELLGETKTISVGDQISGLLNDKAGAANERASRAEKAAADVSLEAEQLKADNLALEARLAPRRLSHAELEGLKAAVKPFVSRGISIWSYGIDLEAGILAGQIKSALQDAGAPGVDSIGHMVSSWPPRAGVIITGPDDKLVEALLTALKPISAVRGPLDPERVKTAIPAEIFVGVKPLSP